jgi:hypothetical protein
MVSRTIKVTESGRTTAEGVESPTCRVSPRFSTKRPPWGNSGWKVTLPLVILDRSWSPTDPVALHRHRLGRDSTRLAARYPQRQTPSEVTRPGRPLPPPPSPYPPRSASGPSGLGHPSRKQPSQRNLGDAAGTLPPPPHAALGLPLRSVLRRSYSAPLGRSPCPSKSRSSS